VLKQGPFCEIPVQYNIDQVTQPPRLNSSGSYVFHADFGQTHNDTVAFYRFNVTIS
jgi:hypothetical protein